MTETPAEPRTAVRAAGRAAKEAVPALAAAPGAAIDAALTGMAARVRAAAEPVLAANAADVAAAEAGGMGPGLLDRLRLDPARIEAMATQLEVLAALPFPPARRPVRSLPDGLVVQEWQRPVGVIGANFEARPTVVLDIASQLVKSRNAGVLRTGSAAYGSAVALVEQVVGPALAAAGLPADAVQLLRVDGRAGAAALVGVPELISLVILRGSGESTRSLAATAAAAGVRTLAHADGGAVVYLDASADRALAADLIRRSLDRLGVCNRLNLLLIDASCWDELVPAAVEVLDGLGIRADLPPHDHPLGQEWALQDGAEATVTVAPAAGAAAAARIADEHTSGLAATVVATDPAAARAFLAGYGGTGAFWNATPRLLDGWKLLSVPETGITIDRVPGPRGPVTFTDLTLRQYVVVPAGHEGDLDD